jgi:3-oxo-5-alpha-steroid 4-dehydrogenase 1
MLQEKFNFICWVWIAIALFILPVVLKITQPYGKHQHSNWGPSISNRIGWLLMELPALLVFVWFIRDVADWSNVLILTAATLWGLHYIHRSLIFPFRIKTKGKKMSLVIVGSAILFNSVNGYINGYWLAHFADKMEINSFTGIRMAIGIMVFLTGFIINQYHDRILIKLRKGNDVGYQIPIGGLFKYISCPNFLGEMITWIGFLIVTSSLPAMAFLIWTMVNLIPRAIDHHKWYQKYFSDYPVNRKALFPSIL